MNSSVKEQEHEKEVFDPLDMQNYRVEKLPKRSKGKFEKWLAVAGVPLAIISFILLAFVIRIPFLSDIDPERLISSAAKKAYATLGAEGFMRTNIMMLAIFAAALILWITEAIPNYLTSLIIIISLILANVLPEKEALAQLGHPVMWLNIMSFVLASMLVATGVAKRFALWFIIKFGKSASSIFISFILINLVLSAFISATTAKAAILLPIFMVIASIYGAHSGQRNNFGRSIVSSEPAEYQYRGRSFCDRLGGQPAGCSPHRRGHRRKGVLWRLDDGDVPNHGRVSCLSDTWLP
jgi:solute carrier family 13 (sodium-dependent dicarboxylate transporter), member 2/3/5